MNGTGLFKTIASLSIFAAAVFFCTRALADALGDLEKDFNEQNKKFEKIDKEAKERKKALETLKKEIEELQKGGLQGGARATYNQKVQDYQKIAAELKLYDDEFWKSVDGYQSTVQKIWEQDDPKAVRFIWGKLKKGELISPEIVGTQNGVASLKNEEALKYIADELPKSGHSDQFKIAVCMGLKSVTSNVVVEALLQLIEKESWQVASTAAGALENKKVKEAVPRLIAAMNKAEGAGNQRLAADILNALRAITGRHDFSTGTEFEGWWNEKGKDIADFSKVTEVEGKSGGKGKLTTYLYDDITSKRVIFILDTSHSMNAVGVVPGKPDLTTGTGDNSSQPLTGQKTEQDKAKEEEDVNKSTGIQPGFRGSRLDAVKKEFKYILDNLPDDTKFNVIFFNSQISSVFQKLTEATDANKTKAWDAIKNSEGIGMTNTYGALTQALSDKDVDTIYFLTDGAPTFGQVIHPERICSEIKELNAKRNVRIHCVALLFGIYAPAGALGGAAGEQKKVMEDFLRRLSKENDGTFRMFSDDEK